MPRRLSIPVPSRADVLAPTRPTTPIPRCPWPTRLPARAVPGADYGTQAARPSSGAGPRGGPAVPGPVGPHRGHGIAIVALPDTGGLTDDNLRFAVTQDLIAHAQKYRYRFAIVDGRRGLRLTTSANSAATSTRPTRRFTTRGSRSSTRISRLCRERRRRSCSCRRPASWPGSTGAWTSPAGSSRHRRTRSSSASTSSSRTSTRAGTRY